MALPPIAAAGEVGSRGDRSLIAGSLSPLPPFSPAGWQGGSYSPNGTLAISTSGFSRLLTLTPTEESE
jgi:hypothetical protein